MAQKTFSPSSLGSFENCPRQYWFRYVHKVEVDTEGIEAFVGKRVHEILERLYQFVAEDMVPSLERVIWRYHKVWEQHFRPERLRIVRREMKPHDYRMMGARCIENYYRRHYPFDHGETLGIERKITVELDPIGRYKMRGIVDRLTRAPDGALEIHDYKTGRRVPRQDELDDDRQLGVYELALRQELGEEGPVRLVWHYLLSNQERHSERSPAQREALRERVIREIDGIRAEQEWAPRTSGLCDWCEYRQWCPAFGGEPPPKPSLGSPGDEADDRSAQLDLI